MFEFDCVEIVRKELAPSILTEYHRLFVGENIHERIMLVAGPVFKSFKESLTSGVSWLSKKTKIKLSFKDKHNPTELRLGNYDSNAVMTQEIFDDLEFQSPLLMENILMLRLLMEAFKIDQVNRPDKLDMFWVLQNEIQTKPGVDIISEINQMHVRSSLLHEPYFNLAQPEYVNFGLTGYNLAWLEANDFVNTRNIENWWSDKDRLEYIKQAENFMRHLVKLWPDLEAKSIEADSIDHLVMDQAAINAAHSGYMQSIDALPNKPPATKVDGRRLNHKHLFWLTLASNFCACQEKTRDGNYPSNVPSRYVLNFLLQNSQTFADDYQCQKRDRMRLDQKNKLNFWE